MLLLMQVPQSKIDATKKEMELHFFNLLVNNSYDTALAYQEFVATSAYKLEHDRPQDLQALLNRDASIPKKVRGWTGKVDTETEDGLKPFGNMPGESTEDAAKRKLAEKEFNALADRLAEQDIVDRREAKERQWRIEAEEEEKAEQAKKEGEQGQKEGEQGEKEEKSDSDSEGLTKEEEERKARKQRRAEEEAAVQKEKEERAARLGQVLDAFKKNHKAAFADDKAKEAVKKVKDKGEDTTREEVQDAGRKVLEAQRRRQEWEEAYEIAATGPKTPEKSDTSGLSEYEQGLQDIETEPDPDAPTDPGKETGTEPEKEEKSNPGGARKKVHKTPSELEEEDFLEEARKLKLREERRKQKKIEESAGKKGEAVTVKSKGGGKGTSKPSDVLIPKPDLVRPVLGDVDTEAPAEGDMKRNRPTTQSGHTSRVFPCGSFYQQRTNKEEIGLKQCLKEPDTKKLERILSMQYYHPRYNLVYLIHFMLLTSTYLLCFQDTQAGLRPP